MVLYPELLKFNLILILIKFKFNLIHCLSFFFFFFKVFGGHMSFFGATGTPVLDFW